MTGTELKQRLAAILAADVAGYSRLMAVDDRATVIALDAARAVFRSQIEANHGRIIDMAGDSVLAVFDTATGAVSAALTVQRELKASSGKVSEDRRMCFRIGIHIGDVIEKVDGSVYGDGVNIAARLEGLAEPGGITVSDAVQGAVRGKVNASFVDQGEQRVKNIPHPVRAFAVHEGGKATAAPRKLGTRKRPVELRAIIFTVVLLAAASTSLHFAAPEFSQRVRTSAAALLAGKSADAAAATIAVLPFVNQSGEPRRDYFSDGVTEDIITALGRFSGVRVSARNAVQAYKGRNASPAEISRDLGVRYLVQGSVRQADTRVRVAVELSDAGKGTLLWSEHYEGEGKEVFEIQDRIVRNVVGALAVKLTSLEQQRVAEKPPESMDAYDLVLRARELMRTTDRKHIREAMALLNQALQLSPNYAAAHAALASCELQRALFGWVEDPASAVRRAEAAAQRALAADDPGARARALGVLASLHTFTGNFDAGLDEADRAIALNASDAVAHSLRSGVLMWLGRIPESIAAGEAARRYDPRLPSEGNFNLGMAYYLAGRYRDALAAFNDTLRAEPDLEFLQAGRAAAAAQLGDIEQAAQAIAALRRLDPFFKLETYGNRLVNSSHRAKIQEGLRKAGL